MNIRTTNADACFLINRAILRYVQDRGIASKTSLPERSLCRVYQPLGSLREVVELFNEHGLLARYEVRGARLYEQNPE